MNRYKETRQKKGIKQSELAKMLSVSQATLSNWERGVHDPDSESLLEMANILDVTTDYLLNNQSNTAADIELERAYFRITKDAKESGISPDDLQMALDFLKMARERDENA